MKKIIATILVVMLVVSGFSVFAERINNPMIANDFTKQTNVNTTLNFTSHDFTSSVNPPNDGRLVSVIITQLTNAAAGTLRLGTESVKKNEEISVSALNKLNFVPAKDYRGEAIFTWNANYGTASSPYPSAVVITVGDEISKVTESTSEPTETPVATPEAEHTPSPTPAPAPTQKPLQYEDMLTHWGAYSAGMLGAEGIIVGEEIGGHFYFYPDKILTRMDFIILANSIFGIKTKDSLADNPFYDTGVPDYMLRQAIAAYEGGLITGVPAGNNLYLKPFERLTRAEAVKILDNGLKLEHPAREALSFSDTNDIPDWAVSAVQNLEAYGIIRGYGDNSFRPNEIISKAQASEMLYQVHKYKEKARKTQSVFHHIFYGSEG